MSRVQEAVQEAHRLLRDALQAEARGETADIEAAYRRVWDAEHQARRRGQRPKRLPGENREYRCPQCDRPMIRHADDAGGECPVCGRTPNPAWVEGLDPWAGRTGGSEPTSS